MTNTQPQHDFEADYAYDTEQQRTFPMSDDTPLVEILPGVHQRTSHAEGGLMLREFMLESGAIVPEHTHPVEHSGYVVSGRLELRLKGQATLYRTGERYSIPKHIPHSARALKDTLLVEVYRPVRPAPGA